MVFRHALSVWIVVLTLGLTTGGEWKLLHYNSTAAVVTKYMSEVYKIYTICDKIYYLQVRHSKLNIWRGACVCVCFGLVTVMFPFPSNIYIFFSVRSFNNEYSSNNFALVLRERDTHWFIFFLLSFLYWLEQLDSISELWLFIYCLEKVFV